jgi:Cdc6-like AAA superfamily ATPase
MAKNVFSEKNLDAFHSAAQSLKLYRRAELTDPESNDPLVDELYVDPLPNDHVFKTLLKAHTTYLIGRRGTGKSTLFQKLQSELRKKGKQTSAYIDIKTVYESSQVDPALLERVKAHTSALPPESIEKLLLFREFIHAVITEIKNEIQKRLDSSFWEKVKDTVRPTSKDLFEGLDALLDDVKQEKFQSILGVYTQNVKTTAGKTNTETDSFGVESELSQKPKLSAKASVGSESKISAGKDIEFSDILLRTIDIKQIISQLKSILDRAKIRNLYILLDDFSELPEPAMKVVVDVLIMPLNNWSDEFIKFKIAAYPGRIYYGNIDKTKIDEIYLDLYKLYGGGDVARMEESAIDFTRRLIESRVKHFCKIKFEDYLENPTNIWQTFFYASMANPRILGYLLYFLHESHLIRRKKITASAIQEAAQKYFEEKVESYFTLGKFLQESFKERSSIFSLKELLESIVKKARELRYHESEVMKKIQGTPPTSHFHVPVEIEPIFLTLELNFFLTKYFEQTDRNGNKVSVYVLNYGLCSKFSIRFGRPTGDRSFRLYFVERFFDYAPIVREFITKNQEITCKNCGFNYPFDSLPALKYYNMKCKECEVGTVEVFNLSKQYEEELKRVDQGLLLPETELGILQTLHSEVNELRPGFIAAELDCSHQLVGKRARNLIELDLIKKRYQQNVPFYKLEEKAEEIYFSPEQREELDIPPDGQENVQSVDPPKS